MGIFDSFKKVFSGARKAATNPARKSTPTETRTITSIRGVEFDEEVITSLTAVQNRSLVILAFLDGRRVQGQVFNFSATRPKCQFFPFKDGRKGPGEEIDFKQLKAIFFLHEGASAELVTATVRPGRRLEVTFSDNERLRGTTTGFSRERLGFFVTPHDPTGKISRVFVINANAREVKWL